MDVHRVLLVAVVCLGVAGPVAQAQDSAVTAQAARVKAPDRMAAQTPFVLGGTVQTDWGGNVGY